MSNHKQDKHYLLQKIHPYIYKYLRMTMIANSKQLHMKYIRYYFNQNKFYFKILLTILYFTKYNDNQYILQYQYIN